MGWGKNNNDFFGMGAGGEDPVDLTGKRRYFELDIKQTPEDIALQPERYAKLIKLGATPEQAAECSKDHLAFLALRIYLRGK